MAHCRSLGFPGFPVESCGFGQLHVVLFEENHKSGAGESCEVGNPGTLGMTKRRGLLIGIGPLPRDRAVVGGIGALPRDRALVGGGTPFPSISAIFNRFPLSSLRTKDARRAL
jgi:hypothetical protein